MVGKSDRSADTPLLANRQILVEGLSALDGRCVGADVEVDIISRSIGVNRALISACGARIVGSVLLNNIVLNQGTGGPTVQCDQAVTTGIDGASIRDGAISP